MKSLVRLALLCAVGVMSVTKYNVTDYCPVASLCGDLPSLDARHECAMNHLWGVTHATQKYLVIMQMPEGLGNNFRALAGATGLAMALGRGLMLDYRDIENNFDAPTARGWQHNDDAELAAEVKALKRGHWGTHRLVDHSPGRGFKLDPEVDGVQRFLTAAADPFMYVA